MSTDDTVTHQPSLHCATSTTAEEPVEKTSIEKQSRTAPTGWRVPSGNVLLAFTVGIAAAALFYIVPQSSPSNFASSSKSHPRGLTMDNTSVPLPPKYQSDIVAMTPRTLLFPDASCDPPSVAYPSGHNYGTDSFVSIEYALDQDLRLSGHVLLLLNGDNHGLLFEWSPSDGGSSCLFELAEAAASMLGADSALFPNGLRLYNLDGHPIASAADLDQGGRVAYILTDFQLWVWPGIAVGYSRVVDSSVTLTTLSLSPLVFDVEHFFQSNEADVIIADGGRHLERSPVVGAEDGSDYDDDRTSFTGFLNDSALTRDFQRRTARLARLPSPSFVERLQLVRYEQGQWFRRHEDYYDSKDFANRKRTAAALYADWLEFLRRQGGDDQEDGEENGLAKVPPVTELAAWELTLLAAFLEDAAATDLFAHMGATDWKEYLYAAANENNHKAVQEFIQEKGMAGLHLVIQSYERRHPHGEPYNVPPQRVSGVTQFHRWLRWAKERVAVLGPTTVSAAFQPSGEHYPKFTRDFQTKLLKWMIAAYSRHDLLVALNESEDWVDWLLENENANETLLHVLAEFPDLFPLIAKVFATHAGPAFDYETPQQLKYQEANRFVTLFLYLNDVDEGGETVFPYSPERLVTNIDRGAMSECSEGLAVPPTRLHAALFYAQTGANDLDPKSLHGGCPPAKGVKCKQRFQHPIDII